MKFGGPTLYLVLLPFLASAASPADKLERVGRLYVAHSIVSVQPNTSSCLLQPTFVTHLTATHAIFHTTSGRKWLKQKAAVAAMSRLERLAAMLRA